MSLPMEIAGRVEELLREQLRVLGVDEAALQPHDIVQNMRCNIWPDQSMVYFWKEQPVLRVVREEKNGGIAWRMFTAEDMELV